MSDCHPIFRLLVCDANMDVRDCLRELVLPLTRELVPGEGNIVDR